MAAWAALTMSPGCAPGLVATGIFAFIQSKAGASATAVTGDTTRVSSAGAGASGCACKRQWMRTSVYTVLPIPMPSAKMPPR